VPTLAQADIQDVLYLTVDGNEVTIPVSSVATGSTDTASTFAGTLQTAGYDLEYSGYVDSDPFVSYGFTILDLGFTPLVVSAGYPVSLTGGPFDSAHSSLSLSVTGGPFGFTVTPTGPGGLVQTAVVGAPDVTMAVGGPCSGAAFRTVSCYAAQTATSLPALPFSTLDVNVNFDLTGFGSQATVNGRVDLFPVPEPAFLGVEELGALGALLMFLRRKQLARLVLGV
jgi:hypothetical protein